MEKFAVGRRQAYYELFKACRLCGSGGGYKMPIVRADSHSHSHGDGEPELRHKIRDCCSIDVHLEDKMPPLICELCVDKVNDFYEFREMCRVTNSRVRVSLGLPPQNLNQDTSEDCILGVSGPLIFNSKELEMSQNLTQRPIKLKVSLKDKKSPKILPSRHSPIPEKRSNNKKEQTSDNLSLLSERLTKRKRVGESSTSNDVSIKKLRFSDPPAKSASSNKAEKRINANEQMKKSKELPGKRVTFSSHFCDICKTSFTKSFSLKQHLTTQHTPNIIPEKFGCTPCRDWFPSVKLAEEHHKWHRNSSTFYNCDRCSTKFKVLLGYTRHFKLKQCIPEKRVPDVVCSECQQSFATNYLIEHHKCPGPQFSGECSKCKKHFVKRISLKKHESLCKKLLVSPQVNPNNPHLKVLKPIQITMLKCDGLLEKIKKEPVDDEDLNPIYDISRISDFPGYIVKSEPPEFGFNDNCEMDIKPEIKTEYPDYNSDYGDVANDYSSNESGSDVEASQTPNFVINPFARKNNTQVESLSFISLRSIFSIKMFKKKSRPKSRTPKIEKSHSKSSFDSLLAESNKSTENNQTMEEMSIQNSTAFVNDNSDSLLNSDNDTIFISNVQNMQNPKLEQNLNFGTTIDSIPSINNENVKNIDIENSTTNAADFNNTNVLDRITITSVEGNTSINFENDCSKICDERTNNQGEHIQNEETPSDLEILGKYFKSKVFKTPDCQDDGLLQSNNDVTNSIDKSMDFNIESVFEDHLNSSLIKETSENEIDETQNKSENLNNVEHLLKSENLINIETQNISDDLNKTPEDFGKKTDQENNSGSLTSAENLLKSSEELINNCTNFEISIKSNDLNSDEDSLKIPKDFGMETNQENNSGPLTSAKDLLKSSEEIINNCKNIEIPIKSDYLSNVENFLDASEDVCMKIVTQNKKNDLNNAESMLKSSDDLSVNIESQNKIDDLKNVEDLLKSEVFNMEVESQSNSDILSSVEGSLKSSKEPSMDYEIQRNDVLEIDKTGSKILNTEISSIALTTANNFLKTIQDSQSQDVIEKSDSDILDLVSDSGDDCNIIDSPEKLKVLEDQLLLEEMNNEKYHKIETQSSALSQNNVSLNTKRNSEYDVNINETELENGTSLPIENKVSSELMNSHSNLSIVQEKNTSNYSNFSSPNMDQNISQSDESEIKKLLDNVNAIGALHDMNSG